MHIAVIGAGYVGLVSGVSFARDGHDVTLVERDPSRIADLRGGRMPFEEPGLADAFAENATRLTIVDAIGKAQLPDLVFVAVATPVGENGDSELGQIEGALADLRPFPDVHVSVRSTLPPGFSARLPELLGRRDGERISTNPEFLRQGSAVYDVGHPSRMVFGRFPETSDEHLALLDRAYAGIDAPRLTVDVAAAELIKNAANAFLALKLSFVNEIAALSEEYGVEVGEVLDGIALDPRIGSAYMRPGLGFGGSCLPKELQVLATAGQRRGLAMHIARAAAVVNFEQQDRFVDRIIAELPPSGRVGLLGLSFKAGTDDLRGSPAVRVALGLLEAGHTVIAYDPAVRPERARSAAPGLQLAATAIDVFREADAAVIATEWPEFADLDWSEAAHRMRCRLLFDGRRLIEPSVVVAAGLSYRGIGRNPSSPALMPQRGL